MHGFGLALDVSSSDIRGHRYHLHATYMIVVSWQAPLAIHPIIPCFFVFFLALLLFRVLQIFAIQSVASPDRFIPLARLATFSRSRPGPCLASYPPLDGCRSDAVIDTAS